MTLAELGEKCGTDKGTLHSYLPVYEELLAPLRDEPISLLEIGVAAGASIRMWLEWFPNAAVYGIDIGIEDQSADRVKLFGASAADEDVLHGFRQVRFDVVIDDGSHRSADQLLACHALWRCLKPGGFYFVEDVQSADYVHYWSMMPGFRAWQFHKGGRYDDILVMLRK